MRKSIKKVVAVIMVLALSITLTPKISQAAGLEDVYACIGKTVEMKYTLNAQGVTIEAVPTDTSIVTTRVEDSGIVITPSGMFYAKTIFYTGVAAGTTAVNIIMNGSPYGTINVTVGDHVWDEGKIKVAATCQKEGSIEYTCTKCKEKKTEVIPKAPHTKEATQTIDKEATCLEDGQKSYHCSVCKEIIPETIEVIPSLGGGNGHAWKSDYTVDTEPTYFEDGEKSIHCSVCDAIKEGSTVSISKLVLKATSLTKAVNVKKKSIQLNWKKVSAATEYEVQYATDKKFKNEKTIYTKKCKCKITKLKKKKTYYVRVRCNIDSKNDDLAVSKWTKVKRIIIEK